MDRIQPPDVTYEPIAWDNAARSHLGRIAGETESALDHYQSAVDQGQMSLHGVFLNRSRVGSITTMIDHDFIGRVLFVTGMGAEPVNGVSLTHDAAQVFLPALAQSLECKALRFWTRRAGFVRALELEGFKPVYVMEKEIA